MVTLKTQGTPVIKVPGRLVIDFTDSPSVVATEIQGRWIGPEFNIPQVHFQNTGWQEVEFKLKWFHGDTLPDHHSYFARPEVLDAITLSLEDVRRELIPYRYHSRRKVNENY